MTVSATARWVLLALVGLAIAIGIAVLAANLTSQQIGIAAESVSAGDALAPSLSDPAEAKLQGEGRDRGAEEEPAAPGETVEPPATRPEEITAPPGEEAAESPGEGGTDDYGGHGSDGDD